jgi:quercetin dioxygenase-like cupin family protein
MPSRFFTKSQCSRHTIFKGVDIHTLCGNHLMISVVDLAPNSVVEEHSHPHEQLGYLLEGEVTFTVGDETKVLRAGEMWLIPGGVKHKVVVGDRPARAIDVFYPIRDDYR